MENKIGCSVLVLLSFLSAHACTEFRVVSQDKSVVIGRSMEWGDDMHSRIVALPRGKNLASTSPDGQRGLTWESRYGFVYVDSYGVDGATDGMNEKGLTVSALVSSAQFQTVPEGKQDQALAHTDVVLWALSTCATIDDVREAITHWYVWGAPVDLPHKKNVVIPLHFGVYDASGKGIVIEYTKQGLKIYDNEVGVLTNNPAYNWHVTNLQNYVGLSSAPAQPMKFGDLTIYSTGQGSGLRGIPGDPTPPSRFVRAFTMAHLADPVSNAHEAVTLASHILNTVDIPFGVISDVVHNMTFKDYAQWILIKDLTNKHLYFRTYKNSTLRRIDLTALDFAPSAEKLYLAVEDGAPAYVDVTKQLKK